MSPEFWCACIWSSLTPSLSCCVTLAELRDKLQDGHFIAHCHSLGLRQLHDMVKQLGGEALLYETYGCSHRLRSCCARRYKLCCHNPDCRAIDLGLNGLPSLPDTILHTSAWPLQTVAALTEKRRKERTTTVNPSNILAGGLLSWEERCGGSLRSSFFPVPQWQEGRSLYQGSLPCSWLTHALYAQPISAAQHSVARFLLKLSRFLSDNHARQE